MPYKIRKKQSCRKKVKKLVDNHSLLATFAVSQVTSDERAKPNQTNKMKKIVKYVTSEIDEQNRQFIWTLFSDGSAQSCEVARHLNHACSATATWREDHAVNSEMARLIAAMP